jgi:hypothetical protein
MDMSADRLIIKYDMEGPVDLQALSASFDGLSSEYRRLLERHGLKPADADAKLYLTRIEMGCVEAEIGSAAWAFGQTMQTMDYGLIFADMSGRIKQIMDWAGKGSEQKPADLTIGECRDFRNFLSAVSGRKNASVSVKHAKIAIEEEAAGTRRRIVAEMSLAEPEIDRAELVISREIEELSAKDDTKYRIVQGAKMKLWQANAGEGKSGARSADLAVIREVSDRPLPIFFLPTAIALKSRLINVEGNILRMNFFVDVHVKYEGGRPRSYTLLDVHGHSGGDYDDTEGSSAEGQS